MIDQYDSRDLINSKIIGSGGSAFVYVANWKSTSTKYAIKKSVNNKEVCLTIRANSHENIIQFRGVTKLEDEKKYSIILEYADGGTLGKYLRNNTIEWKNQLRFAKEIASAICWLHDKKGIIHGDLHPNNILIHKDAVNGVREEPVPNTNVKFTRLYRKCWEQEPDERPNISEVNETLNMIDSENDTMDTASCFKGSEESKKTEFRHSCQIDLNKLCRKL
ncbi:unnamed protein product [Rhizophagus irregularis]|nr:unnamed protein product [Rhizophagus irregularis]